MVIVKRIPFYRISWKATGRAQTCLRSRIGTKVGIKIGSEVVDITDRDQSLATIGGAAAERGL